MTTLLILLIPLFGTSLGSATVFFLKNDLPSHLQKALLGFASGIMIAASVWSLLIPAIQLSDNESPLLAVLPAGFGFLCGIGFLLLMDILIPHLLNRSSAKPPLFSKMAMMLFAITLHNVPEGMAVGVTCAGANVTDNVSVAAALALSVGVAIQNFPEGAIVSLPLREHGFSRSKSFLAGVASGVVEPIGGLLVLLVSSLTPLLSFLLAFAAGAMIYVVTEELIPEAHTDSPSLLPTVGLSIGFVLMMTLDILLG